MGIDGCPAYTNISDAIGPALEPKATSLRRQAGSVGNVGVTASLL